MLNNLSIILCSLLRIRHGADCESDRDGQQGAAGQGEEEPEEHPLVLLPRDDEGVYKAKRRVGEGVGQPDAAHHHAGVLAVKQLQCLQKVC